MAEMLLGAFNTSTEAEAAIADLEDHGYTTEEISVISHRGEEGGDHESDTEVDGHAPAESKEAGVAKSASSGAAAGGVLGGLAGLLAGAAVWPAVVGLVVGGPLAAALGVLGTAATTAVGAAGGAAAGGMIGALTKLGVPEEAAKSYDETVNRGGVVVGVSDVDGITTEARDILEKHGAQHISVVQLVDDDDETPDGEPIRA